MDSHTSRPRQRAMPPHVVTQWQEEQSRLQLAPRLAKSASSYLRPADQYLTPHRTPNSVRQSPSLSQLTPSPIEKWDIGSIRHIRQYSDQDTPTSSVDSIFELPSGELIGSPNSSTNSYFVAELEDTSPHPAKIASRSRGYSSPVKPQITTPPKMAYRASSPVKAPVLPPATMEFRTAQMTSRAVIKVIDETIAAIEDTNRQLLSRAIAAEEVAQMMQERNLELEFKIKHYSQSRHHNRPNTAPAPASESRRPRHRSATTPVSAFNATLLDPNGNHYVGRQTKSQLPPERNRNTSLNPSPSIPLSRPVNLDLAPLSPYTNAGFPPHPSPRSPNQPSPLRPTHNLHPPHSQPQSNSRHHNPHNLHISPIIPGSVTRHEVTYDGAPLSSAPRAQMISLAEARRRAKPLPPLGPMSPSVLRGVVEIGSGGGREDPRDIRTRPFGKRDERGLGFGFRDDFEKRKRGFSGLFARRRGREKGESFF